MATKFTGMFMLEAMDNLWFHHIVLFSEHSLFLSPEIPKTPLHTTKSAEYASKDSSQFSVVSEQEISPLASIITDSHDSETSSQESDHDKSTTTNETHRPTRLTFVSSKTRCNSSSPISSQKKSRKIKYSQYSAWRLQKTMSCKSLEELEIEEVKGFMDLGFNFKKEKLSKHLMRLIPGLQRIDNSDHNVVDADDDDYNVDEKKWIMRPYLSEAWLVKRHNSELLDFRVPNVCNNGDMKKHLKCWARTIASTIKG